MLDSQESDNIIQFPGKAIRSVRNIPVTRKRYDYPERECQHVHFEIDESKGTVRCLDCDTIVPPFIALLAICRNRERYDNRLDQYQAYLEHEKQERDKDKLRYEKRKERMRAKGVTFSDAPA